MITLDTIWSAQSQQRVYRKILEAFSFPGRAACLVQDSSSENAALHVLAVFCDEAVTLADLSRLIDGGDWVRLGAKRAEASKADLVLACGDILPKDKDWSPRLGDVYQPHLGATVILFGRSVTNGPVKLTLAGPGIREEICLSVDGFDPVWFEARNQWVSQYPMGVDCILCDDKHVIALPRTTTLKTANEFARLSVPGGVVPGGVVSGGAV